MKKFVVYIRVSTKKQGASGLGLEAQQKICGEFIKNHDGEKVAEYKDVESGTHRDRKGLADAVAYCKKNNCALVIAKLDRLARDVEFCFKIVNTGIEIHFCDMPQVNTLLLGVFASVAQYERELTSDRTRKALAAKKERGEVTGGASEKWIESFNNKTKEQIDKEYMERGRLRNERYLASRDVQVFLKIIKNVFASSCVGDDATLWNWSDVTTKGDYRARILGLMKDYKELDESGTLFARWDFSDLSSEKLRVRLCGNIQNVRKSLEYNKKVNDNGNKES
jgi:DNA invertase Pin-like site-specific DNA recombinase